MIRAQLPEEVTLEQGLLQRLGNRLQQAEGAHQCNGVKVEPGAVVSNRKKAVRLRER